MALTEIFVDPSIAADSGTGTIGDPYGDLEYAIEQETFDTTNGTRVNVLTGTDEVLAASIDAAMDDVSVSVAWVPTEAAPLVIQGYSVSAGDGGVGGISGGGSVTILDGNKNYIKLVDLHMHNVGAGDVLDLGLSCLVLRCEVDTTSAGNGIDGGVDTFVISSHIHDIGGTYGINVSTGDVMYCVVDNNVSGSVGAAIRVTSGVAYRNIVTIDAASDGIWMADDSLVINNSIYSDAGTGSGINVIANVGAHAIMNNLIEGFSGSGGKGVEFSATNASCTIFGANSIFNCETQADSPSAYQEISGYTNENLTVSPFTDAATGDFSPVDTGTVKEGSEPSTFPA